MTTLLVFSLFWLFSFVSAFLTSLIKFILWLKFCKDKGQTENMVGVGGRGHKVLLRFSRRMGEGRGSVSRHPFPSASGNVSSNEWLPRPLWHPCLLLIWFLSCHHETVFFLKLCFGQRHAKLVLHPGIKPMSPGEEAAVLTTGLPGKTLLLLF